jgi:hypothetical protein
VHGLSETDLDWIYSTEKGDRKRTRHAWKHIAAALPHRRMKAVWSCATRMLHEGNNRVISPARPGPALPCPALPCLVMAADSDVSGASLLRLCASDTGARRSCRCLRSCMRERPKHGNV